jgi:hypothetical protein
MVNMETGRDVSRVQHDSLVGAERHRRKRNRGLQGLQGLQGKA